MLVDSTDVTVWYKISKLALTLRQYSLARHAYEQVQYPKRIAVGINPKEACFAMNLKLLTHSTLIELDLCWAICSDVALLKMKLKVKIENGHCE